MSKRSSAIHYHVIHLDLYIIGHSVLTCRVDINSSSLQVVWKVFLQNQFSIFVRSFNKKTSGDQGAVAKAKANIEEHFVVVGLLEKVIMGLLMET